MKPEQRQLWDQPSSNCLFCGYLDDDDHHCMNRGLARPGYDVLAEDSPDLGDWLAEVRWVDINDVRAKDITLPTLPAYVPTITSASARLFEKYHPPVVAVKLGDVVSAKELRVAKSLEQRFGIPPGTSVILQSYAKDSLLENLWPRRHEIFSKLAKLGFSAVTAVNYSVWDVQPHAERLINIKRSLLTYEDWQNLGVPAIPHIYWSGPVNLDAWLHWLATNPTVSMVAIDMQTLRTDKDWTRALEGLKYFVGKLSRPIHFLITGPQTPLRVLQIRQLLPSVTLTNGTPARAAFASHRIDIKGAHAPRTYSRMNKSLLLRHNTQSYRNVLQPGNEDFVERLLVRTQASVHNKGKAKVTRG
jgi:hypothetical protein